MKKQQEQRGVVLVALVLGIGIFALGSTLVVTSGIISQVAKNRNMTSGYQTFYTAEAAARDGVFQYLDGTIDGEQTIVFSDEQLLNNTISGEITISEDNFEEYKSQVENGTLSGTDFYCAGPCKRIGATAQNGHTNRTVHAAVTTYPAGLALNFATYAENDLSITGNATIDGNIFANGTIGIDGSAAIDGNAYSPNEIEGIGHVTGSTYQAEPIPAPELDLGPYYDEATDEGTLFFTAEQAEAYIKNKQQEANIYVLSTDADSEINMNIQGNNTELTGSLVVENGNLRLSGGTYTADENHVALFVDGNLTLSGGVIINGIVYVKGTTTFGGGDSTINGSLISVNGVNTTDITGNVTIVYDPSIIEDLYGDYYDENNGILGFGNDGTGEARIVSWSES